MARISLSELASRISGEVVNDNAALRVERAPCASSAKVIRDGIFVAIRGNAGDGHTYLGDAFSRGAGVAVVEDGAGLQGHPGIVVANTRKALSSLASLACDDPSHKMRVIGVTGTNGKTTTNWIIYHVLNALGAGSLRVGTLGTECMGKAAREGALTSPDPVFLHQSMADALHAGATSCVMEVSSHALDQARVEDVSFDVAIFTNLTRDHLDYHKTFDHYFAAKSHLFYLLGKSAKETRGAVVNLDDPYGAQLWLSNNESGLVDYSFGRDPRARYRIVEARETPQSMVLRVAPRGESEVLTIHAPFIGPHNAENVVAAFAAVSALGYPRGEIIDALKITRQVPGRLERVGDGGPRVFVDYAHTPDALERVLRAMKVSTEGKLWCVFGCGGDRDSGKRPEMARIAAQHADRVVVTSDNPRTEDPQAIIDEILTSGIKPAAVNPDRAAAIRHAITEAALTDTIVVAGKGHENYQIIGASKVYFSDQEVSLKALSERADSHKSL